MSKQHCRTLQVKRFFRQCWMLFRHCCWLRQQCWTKFRPFDIVETNWTCSICFDIVKRTKFYNRIVRQCCHLWQQSRMLLRQSWTLLRLCCWCGRGPRDQVCLQTACTVCASFMITLILHSTAYGIWHWYKLDETGNCVDAFIIVYFLFIYAVGLVVFICDCVV